jgi:hypothetical protein
VTVPSDTETPGSSGLSAAVRSLDEQLQILNISSGIGELDLIAVESDWPVSGGLPPDVERIAVDELLRALSFEADWLAPYGRGAFAEYVLQPGPWVQLLRVVELRNRVDVNDELSLELWSTQSVRFNLGHRTSPIPPLLYALRFVSEAETHLTGGLGWHIHPVEHGRHLGYRLLFDATKTQNDLAWEAHSHPSRRPWGDPMKSILAPGTSVELHKSAQRAVRAQSTLRKFKFKVWAGKFVQPSSATFVAHPPHNQPVPWWSSSSPPL